METAYRAGRLTLGHFRSGVQVRFKEDDTPVTAADREAEKLIRRRIERAYPGHAILGEEEGEKAAAGASHKWIIDPIDGTKAFIRGVPLYAVLIGLEIEDRIEVGVVYFPALDEMVYAAAGCGCFCNGRRVRVSAVTELSGSAVSFTDSASFERAGKRDAWERLERATAYHPGWTDAYGHALVATGRIEIMLDPFLNPWDGAPFPVLLREAGGYFGDWSGRETIYNDEGLSTSAALLPKVLELLQRKEK